MNTMYRSLFFYRYFSIRHWSRLSASAVDLPDMKRKWFFDIIVSCPNLASKTFSHNFMVWLRSLIRYHSFLCLPVLIYVAMHNPHLETHCSRCMPIVLVMNKYIVEVGAIPTSTLKSNQIHIPFFKVLYCVQLQTQATYPPLYSYYHNWKHHALPTIHWFPFLYDNWSLPIQLVVGPPRWL